MNYGRKQLPRISVAGFVCFVRRAVDLCTCSRLTLFHMTVLGAGGDRIRWYTSYGTRTASFHAVE